MSNALRADVDWNPAVDKQAAARVSGWLQWVAGCLAGWLLAAQLQGALAALLQQARGCWYGAA